MDHKSENYRKLKLDLLPPFSICEHKWENFNQFIYLNNINSQWLIHTKRNFTKYLQTINYKSYILSFFKNTLIDSLTVFKFLFLSHVL